MSKNLLTMIVDKTGADDEATHILRVIHTPWGTIVEQDHPRLGHSFDFVDLNQGHSVGLTTYEQALEILQMNATALSPKRLRPPPRRKSPAKRSK